MFGLETQKRKAAITYYCSTLLFILGSILQEDKMQVCTQHPTDKTAPHRKSEARKETPYRSN
jgi:hypothetical protein